MIEAQAAGAGEAATRPALIDSDVHCEVPKVDALFPYLPDYWIEHIQQTLFKGPVDSYYPSKTSLAAGADGKRVDVTLPGAPALQEIQDERPGPVGRIARRPQLPLRHRQPEQPRRGRRDGQRRQRLADRRVARQGQPPARLDGGPRPAPGPGRPRDRAGRRSPRLRPGAAARPDQPAAREPQLPPALGGDRAEEPGRRRPLRRRADHPAHADRLALLLLRGLRRDGPGVRHPAHQHRLRGRLRPVPGVQVAFLESGWTWIPSHMWRFDKEWKNLRRLVPWVKRAPSEYIREHVRVAIQPLDAPDQQPPTAPGGLRAAGLGRDAALRQRLPPPARRRSRGELLAAPAGSGRGQDPTARTPARCTVCNMHRIEPTPVTILEGTERRRERWSPPCPNTASAAAAPGQP